MFERKEYLVGNVKSNCFSYHKSGETKNSNEKWYLSYS